MSDFFAGKSDAGFCKAVAGLEDRPDAERVYAQATAARAREEWSAAWGLRGSRGVPCIQRLLGKRCGQHHYHDPYCEGHEPPGNDHASLWLFQGRPAVYVSQPYPQGCEWVHEISDFARRYGLRLKINTWPAWHFPTRVLMVEYWNPDCYRDAGLWRAQQRKAPGEARAA